MKKTLLLAFLSAVLPSQGAILVGFYDFDATTTNETHDVADTGFSAVVAKGTDSRAGGGSNDIYYGDSITLTVPNVTNGDGYLRVVNNLTITVSYIGSSPVQLENLFFDATYTTATSGLTLAYQLNGGSFVSITPDPFPADSNASGITTGSDTETRAYNDFSRSLAGLTLNTNDTLVIRFSSGSMRLDNIALTGTIVPEPSALLLSGLGLLPLLRRRRP